ncbi:MAG: pilus assembly protein [Rhodospirillales bacterium RIFCSPLOWO2_12_FULL_58_28]|nr:MAG: pilus assembly protein [Rhodospirillales bacterium RIFCSPLOWO2_02_FULL_58_16]OHC79569.1 MAG: pilus assembly protein [Rhodospirillales bacterium RIFCSPLOWO2_12_FULL_58_28]
MTKRFFDTNILLYLLSSDAAKADQVEEMLVAGAVVSVQVLNELTSVALRKLGMNVAEIREALDPIAAICRVAPLTIDIHQRGLQVAERYRFSFYDALIVAAALDSGCTMLYTEDMQDGQMIDNTLTIKNPFRPRQP